MRLDDFNMAEAIDYADYFKASLTRESVSAVRLGLQMVDVITYRIKRGIHVNDIAGQDPAKRVTFLREILEQYVNKTTPPEELVEGLGLFRVMYVKYFTKMGMPEEIITDTGVDLMATTAADTLLRKQ